MPNPKHPLGPMWIASASAKIAGLVKKEGIALIHSNTNLRITPYTAAAARRAGVPAVWHVRVIRPYPAGLDRLWAAAFDRIVTNSDSVRRRFASFPGAEKKLVTVYNAVDTDMFVPAPTDAALRESLGAARPDDILTGALGRFTWEKGMKHFIDAAHILAGGGAAGIRFVAAGDGPLRAECMAAAANKSAPVSLPGHIAPAELPALMNALDILVLPSLEESFGRVLIEAMACGKPVVASAVGGVPEIVVDGETGYLVPPADPAAIAKRVAELAADPALRASMGTAGRKRVEKLFSLKGHTKALHDIYDELLNCNTASAGH